MRYKIAIGIFNSFVKIRGAGAKTNHRQIKSYKFSDQQNRTYFLELFCKGAQ